MTERADDPAGPAQPAVDGEDESSRTDDGTGESSRVDDAGESTATPSDVPLNIVGHEERDRPGSSGPDGADRDPLAGVDGEATGDGSDDHDATNDDSNDPEAARDGSDSEGATDDSEAAEPIELLVQLAKDGEIDPWDVDVVAVTEEFLAALETGDLRQSGRALFYASVLVRMKSDVLLEEPTDEALEEDAWDAPMEVPEDAPPAFDPVNSLEEEMDRRLQRKHVRGSPETLDELVRELREAERGSWWKESREYDTSGSPAGFDRGTQTLDYHTDDTRRMDGEPTAHEVTERTHGEDIERVIEEVQASIVEHYEAGRPEVLFREVQDAGGSRVQTYLALLFLANRGEVRLQQDELFGDLWIQDPTAELGAEGALA